MRSYRFWMFHNDSWAKIKVKEGEDLKYSYGGPNEEGYSITHLVFFVEGEEVWSEFEEQGSDCDGVYFRSGHSVCRIIDSVLELKPCSDPENGPPGGMVPNWEVRSRFQRDYSAEAAGY